MKDKWTKFYFYCIITNIILILVLTILSGLLLEEYIQPGSFLTQKIGGDDFIFLRNFYFLTASFFFPLAITIIKNFKVHILMFFLISVLAIIFYQIYIYLINSHYENHFPLRAFRETILYMILVSTTIHFSQMIIGKKLLPTKYKNNKS